LAGQSRNPAIISSMCVVFAETEIIGLLASGTTSADIVAGVLTSIATRVAAMSGRDLAQPIALTGGVAMVPGMDAALCAILGKKIIVAPQPQLTCALGAAILAWRQSNGFSTPAA
jgi:activator of 2-hydroxyglutaryl-CoA dehydratase